MGFSSHSYIKEEPARLDRSASVAINKEEKPKEATLNEVQKNTLAYTKGGLFRTRPHMLSSNAE